MTAAPARQRAVAMLLTVAVLWITACSGTSDIAAATTVASTVAPTTTTEPDDGVLRIGALLPLSGPGSDLGSSMHDAVELAVDDANAAGGVGGRPVALVVADEGDGPVSAAQALEELITADVDAVVGPASSLDALDVLVTSRRGRLLTCSPTATALALDDFPDDGLFFRTVPSDSVQAEALARVVDQTGRSSVSILYVDDAYGRPLTNALTARLGRRSLTVEKLVPFSVDDADYANEVETVIDSGAQVIAVIGDAAAGPRVVAAVLAGGGDETVPIIVNDAMRGTTTAAVLAPLRDVDLDRIHGVGVQALSENDDFLAALALQFPESSGLFATNAVECVDLIALASITAGSTRSADVAARMTDVAAGGQRCLTFAECKAALDAGRNIDYDGPSGVVQLSANGDLVRGTYDIFGFDSRGRERPLGTLVVGLDEPGVDT